METPVIKIRRNAEQEIVNKGLSHEKVRSIIEDAITIAEIVSDLGKVTLDNIWAKSTRRDRRIEWKGDSIVVDFFGEQRLKKRQINRQIKKTRKKLTKLHSRLSNKQLTIIIRRQTNNNRYGKNTGSFLSPNRLILYPLFFDQIMYSTSTPSINEPLRRAGWIIHELMHVWFFDKKYGGDTVYGERLAKRLASSNSRKARRSPENFAWFCMRKQVPVGNI